MGKLIKGRNGETHISISNSLYEKVVQMLYKKIPENNSVLINNWYRLIKEQGYWKINRT